MAVFYSSLTSWFPGMLLTYFLNVFEIVPVAPIITGITFVFTFHMRCISIVRFIIIIIIIIIKLQGGARIKALQHSSDLHCQILSQNVTVMTRIMNKPSIKQ